MASYPYGGRGGGRGGGREGNGGGRGNGGGYDPQGRGSYDAGSGAPRSSLQAAVAAGGAPYSGGAGGVPPQGAGGYYGAPMAMPPPYGAGGPHPSLRPAQPGLPQHGVAGAGGPRYGAPPPQMGGGGGGGGGAPPPGGRPYYPPQQQPGVAPPMYRGGPAPAAPVGMWQPTAPYRPGVVAGSQGVAMGVLPPQQAQTTPGGLYRPPQQAGAMMGGGAVQQQVPPPSRTKKALTITDKDGNVIDLGSSVKKPDSSLSAAAAQQPQDSDAAKAAEEAGRALREAAQRAIAEGGAAAIKEKEEKARLAKEKAEQEAREKAEREKKEAEERAERERKEAEEKAERERKEAEERARKEAEEKARKEAEERARKEAEEKARIKAEEEARLAFAARARKEAEEREAAERKAREEREAAAKAPPSTPSPSLSALLARETARATASAAETPAASSTPGPVSTPSLRPGSSSSSSALRPGSSSSSTLRPGSSTLRPGGAGLRPGGASPGLRPGGGGLRPGATPSPASGGVAAPGSNNGTKVRRVYTKEMLLRFRDLDICCCRPSDLPDQTITRASGGGDRGGGRRGSRPGDQWARGSTPQTPQNGRDRRRQSGTPGAAEWSRGQAPPKPPRDRGGGRGGRGRGGPSDDFFDGPVAPLVRSENRWKPIKDTSTMVKTEKQVKSILNKMTKEKFDRLSGQMCDIPILSYEMLTMMIHNIYEKAINEPSFGDMYANLCQRLSQKVKNNTFVKIIESDEEPPTEDGMDGTGGGGSSENTVYRWSNDVGTTDAEVVGPFDSPEDASEAALDPDNAPDPIKRGEMELSLHSLQIKQGTFVKIMTPQDEPDKFYTVFFPVSQAEECGQQLSKIFLSERECQSDATKQNSFKRSLLNKCEDEFNKQDIYVDWKKEKKEYEESKKSLKEAERAEKEEELDFRRMKIKKQMLGNIRFIGELYKKDMLREKIMRYCIHSLLKLEEAEGRSGQIELRNAEDDEMDEEDHEALCNLFTTIGKTIDHQQASPYMRIYFGKISALSNDKQLSARSRFMYKDLIDLRANRWKPRRAQETAKTIDEIRKDAEREERMKEQQSQGGGYRGGDRRGGDRRDRDRDRDSFRGGSGDVRMRDSRRGEGGGSYYGGAGGRQRQQRPTVQTDEHGFTQVRGRGSVGKTPTAIATNPARSTAGAKKVSEAPPARRSPPPPAAAPNAPATAPLSKEKLELRAKNIREEFMQDRENEKDLLLSMDELSGTPDAGKTVVQINVDTAIDCKDNVREAIIAMLVILFKKGKLTTTDFEGPVGDIVEFIDSYVIDSPKAFEYLGDMLSAFLGMKALNIPWLCEQCSKLMNGSDKEKVIGHAIESMKREQGIEEAKSCFGGSNEKSIVDLLGADGWSKMKGEKLS